MNVSTNYTPENQMALPDMMDDVILTIASYMPLNDLGNFASTNSKISELIQKSIHLPFIDHAKNREQAIKNILNIKEAFLLQTEVFIHPFFLENSYLTDNSECKDRIKNLIKNRIREDGYINSKAVTNLSSKISLDKLQAIAMTYKNSSFVGFLNSFLKLNLAGTKVLTPLSFQGLNSYDDFIKSTEKILDQIELSPPIIDNNKNHEDIKSSTSTVFQNNTDNLQKQIEAKAKEALHWLSFINYNDSLDVGFLLKGRYSLFETEDDWINLSKEMFVYFQKHCQLTDDAAVIIAEITPLNDLNYVIQELSSPILGKFCFEYAISKAEVFNMYDEMNRHSIQSKIFNDAFQECTKIAQK